MLVAHLIAEILDLQEKNQVSKEDKHTKEELEYLPENKLRAIKYDHIGEHISHMDFIN